MTGRWPTLTATLNGVSVEVLAMLIDSRYVHGQAYMAKVRRTSRLGRKQVLR